MCGIAGQVSWRDNVHKSAIESMVSGLQHRGPDDQGIWLSSDNCCALGHARLSVIDLSPAGHQPMLDQQSGNVIVFNGEIYNFQDLRVDCERLGYQFRSHTDTEVILALYRFHGEKCVHLLRGMFAFAIWDKQKRRLFIARDRIGKKPFNYALTPSGLIFSSEIDPLSRHPLVSKEMDTDALEFYLQLQYIPAPWTIYRQIRKLPPAHYAFFDEAGFSMHQYWDVNYSRKINISEEDAVDALEEEITESVRLRMVADVPVGAFLSGGVDSSLVTATMANLSTQTIKTFSIGFDEAPYDELRYAKEASDICRTDHYPSIVTHDVENMLSKIVRHYGEPYGDQSAIPSFEVCKQARNQVTVVMNGDGGDELLGGYARYALSTSSINAGKIIGHELTKTHYDPIPFLTRRHRGIGARLARGWMRYIYPETGSFTMYSAFWNDKERGHLISDRKNSVVSGWRTRWMNEAGEHAENPIDKMLWIDSRTYLPGDLTAKMDIASMHCGLETRSPLLDHKLIEFCASLPVGLKVRRGVGKYLLKRLAERHFPASFVHRPKMGFGIPQTEWMQGPLQPLVRNILTNSQLMAPLNPAVIRQTLDAFMLGDTQHGQRIWTLLMYGLWTQHCNSNIA